MSPDGIDLWNVGICDACDKKRAGMRTLPYPGRYCVAEPFGAWCHSSILGNHDRPVPVQSSTIVNSGFLSVAFSPQGQGSIVQIHLFEYEMSRGLQVFSERNKF